MASVILGIDPGTRAVGFGVVREEAGALSFIASGCVRASADNLPERLVTIHRGLRDAVLAHRPTAAAVETVYAGGNLRTALVIGEGRGVALLAAAETGIPVVGYEPATIKRAVAGNGRAGKEQVREMMRALLRLPAPPATDHEADALALAVTHALRAKRPGASSLPATVRDAWRAAGRRELPAAVLAQLPPGVRPARRRK